MNLRRLFELWIVPFTIIGVMTVPFVAWGDRLPDEVAAHWGVSGLPDRGDDPAVPYLIFTGLFTVAWIATLSAITRGKVGGNDARTLVAGLYGLGAFLAGLWLLGLTKSLDVGRWQDAGSLPFWQPTLLMVASLVPAAAGWWLAGGHETSGAEVAGREVEPMRAADGQRLVWAGHATNRKLLIVVAVPLLIILAMAVVARDAWPVLLGSAVVSLLALSLLTRASATVGPDGVRVRLGPFGWPGKRVPLADIKRGTVEDVQPMAYGGWGWRVKPGVQGFIVRCGPGLRIERRRGSDIVVTVDDAERGAAVLAGYLETSSTAP